MQSRHRAKQLAASALVAALATVSSHHARATSVPQPVFQDGFEATGLCAADSTIPYYNQDFALADGSALPDEWSVAGALELADVQQGRARLRPEPSNLVPGRVVAAVPTLDVDVRFTFAMDDVSRQGVGFYVRQNGGHLDRTVPPGEGYAVFLEGFSGDSLIGIWREREGSEERLLSLPTPFQFNDATDYHARFRVEQASPTQTRIQAKTWASGDPEPPAWDIEILDDQTSLQAVEAGIALDVFTLFGGSGSPSGYFDDISITALCDPPEGN